MHLIDWFDIKTAEEGLFALRQTGVEWYKLCVRMKKAMLSLFDSVKLRQMTQLRNELISILDVFHVDSLESFSRTSALLGNELALSLYQTHLGFENLKNVVAQAAMPLAQLFLPAVQTAIAFLTELTQVAGRVIRFLFTGSDEMKDYAAGAKSAAASSNALKKSLAGFDQITRLNGKNGGLGGISNILGQTGSWKSITAKMKELFAPLQDLDFTAAAASLEKLKKVLEPIKQELFSGLEWAWYNLFIPLAKWTVSTFLPVFLDTLTVVMQTFARVIQELQPDFIWLWEECLQPLAQWKGGQIIADLQGIMTELTRSSDWLGLNQGPVDNFIDSMRNMIQAAGELAQRTMALSEEANKTGSAMDVLRNSILGMYNPFQESSGLFWLITSAVKSLGLAFDDVNAAASGAWDTIDGLSSNGWASLKTKLIDPAYNGVRQSMNKIIDLANTLMQSCAAGINFLGSALNALSFTVPSWVPVIGGKGFSFSVRTVTAPQIPYLAQGAVLPANKPFMAVVGDQRHGTNVEAPLTVIQEAVAAVMEDYSAANMAGHQATVGVLQELLEAVLGISIGDDVIAGAVNRYQGKMAVVRGG